jgi:hypothetical protein
MTWLWPTVLVECQPVQRQSSKILTNLTVQDLKTEIANIHHRPIVWERTIPYKNNCDGGSADPNRSGPYTWQYNRLTGPGRRQFELIIAPLLDVVAVG